MTKIIGRGIYVSIGIRSKVAPQEEQTATPVPRFNVFSRSIADGAAPRSMSVSPTAFADGAEFSEKSRDIENTCV